MQRHFRLSSYLFSRVGVSAAPCLLGLALFGLGVFAACSSPGSEDPDAGADPSADAAVEPAGEGGASATEEPAPASAQDPASQGIKIVFLGDSLTAGYGLDEQQAFPFLVEQALAERLPSLRVVNAGVSGDTTAGGLSRLDWLLRQEPEILVVALGGNDGLRGLDPAASEQNLRQIVIKAREKGARVLLAGMLIPPNYGPEYTQAFADLFPRLAQELQVSFIPFLLEGVAGDPDLNQADGIHPTAEGQEILAQTVLKHLIPMLDGLGSDGRASAES